MNMMKHLGGYRAIKNTDAYFKRIWCSKGYFCFTFLHNVHKITMRIEKQGIASQRALATTYLMNVMKIYEGGEFKENFGVQVLEWPDFMKLQRGSYFINLHKFSPAPFGFAIFPQISCGVFGGRGIEVNYE
jgi:hypothetical protein